MSNTNETTLGRINLMLNSLSSDLDHEICEALTAGNNNLAERLNRHLVHTKKVVDALRVFDPGPH